MEISHQFLATHNDLLKKVSKDLGAYFQTSKIIITIKYSKTYGREMSKETQRELSNELAVFKSGLKSWLAHYKRVTVG